MKASKNESTMSNPERIAVLETTILNINTTLLDLRQDIKRGFDKIDNKFSAVDSELKELENKMDNKIDAFEDKMDSKFDIMQDRLWSNFLWLIGMMLGLAGLIAHTQHWI